MIWFITRFGTGALILWGIMGLWVAVERWPDIVGGAATILVFTIMALLIGIMLLDKDKGDSHGV